MPFCLRRMLPRSLLFFFSDGEEGFSGIAAPEEGLFIPIEKKVITYLSIYLFS